MSNSELVFYRENHTKRVAYDLVWVDPIFNDWLETVYGNPKVAFDRWASVVSLEPADDVAKSLPTGGRVFIYNLKKPFLDSVTGLPCYQIDIKGVGLTKSGYIQDKDILEPENERRELMWLPYQEIYFGYENLIRQKKVVRDLRAARSRGHNAPVPLAILNLKQMVYEGKVKSIDQLRKALEIEWAEDFALVIRGYPVSATRICDLTRWNSLVTPGYIPYKTIRTLNWARKNWFKHELPKFLSATKGSFDLEPGRSYFNWFLCTAYRELTLMLTTGFSPSSSHGSNSAYHTHLQNHSTANSHVEWTPLGRVADIDPRYQRIDYLREIIEAEHDALVNIGACCLNRDDFYLIPSFSVFFDQLQVRLRGRRNFLTPSITNQMHDLPFYSKRGRGDNLLLFLNDHLDKF